MPAGEDRERKRPRPRTVAGALFWAILCGLVYSKLLVLSLFGGPMWIRWITFAVLATGFVWLEFIDPDDDVSVSRSRRRTV